jgi:hypothetical protein
LHQPSSKLVGQRLSVVTPHFAACKTAGKSAAVYFIPAAECDQQIAHAVTVLQDFLLQLASIAYQVAGSFLLWCRHTG